MKNKIFRSFLVFFASALVFLIFPAGCFAGNNVPVPSSVSDGMFKKRDYDTSYSNYTSLDLNDTASLSGIKGIKAEGNVITVTRKGSYLLSGNLDSGRVVVDVDEDDKVQLVLDNVTVTCHEAPAIYVASADKVFITTTDGSSNTVTFDVDNVEGDNDAAIYSLCDLTLNGTGTLTVSCPKGHAIATKDDLKITSGKYELSAGKQGLKGKDSIRIAGGDVSIDSTRDGMHSEHRKDTKGFVYICGGSIDISAGRDGIDASNYIVITDCNMKIVSGNGSSDAADDNTDPSCKGICSDTSITIYGGNIEVSTFDDAIHSKGNINILGGNVVLSSGKEAIDGEAEVNVAEGTVTLR